MNKNILISVFFTFSLASACGYDCVSECERNAELIASVADNPETGEIGGLDPENVCDADALKEAASCKECFEAFASVFKLVSNRVGCDCPSETGDAIVFVTNEDCTLSEVEFSDEVCAALDDSADNARMCLQ